VIAAPADGAVFAASNGAADVALQATVAGLVRGQDRVQALLGTNAVGFLDDEDAYIYRSLQPGIHILTIQAVGSDGTPYAAASATDSVTITVTAPCTDENDCDDGDSCTIDSCLDGQCAFEEDPSCGAEGGAEDADEGGTGAICKTNSDCASFLTNPGPCETAICNLETSLCEAANVADGTACDDANACTSADVCSAGVCTSGAAVNCDDSDACTSDSCDPATGCANSSIAATCDDGDACTDDGCDPASGCTNVAKSCDDGNECTLDTCNSATGACANTQNPCDDGNDCTTGSCNAASGDCEFTNNAGPCDDGNACTTGEACVDGACGGGTAVVCDDGDACNGVETCNPASGCAAGEPACGNGTVEPACGEECDDNNTNNNDGCSSICEEEDTKCVSAALCSDGNPCTVDTCNPAVGCEYAPVANGTGCDDQDPCSAVDTCQAGICVGSQITPNCQDAQPVCSLWGASGETVSCFLKLARSAAAEAPAAALQFLADYDASRAKFVNFFDELCIPGFQCFEVPSAGPGASPLSSGHSMSAAPSDPNEWVGKGAVILVHFTAPDTPLSPAYLNNQGEVVGDPAFLEARFTLLEDVPEADPFQLLLSGMVAAEASSNELAVTIQNEVMITSEKP
jgi:cysteine-rich repeat protein